MTQVTIPKEAYETEMARLRAAYVDEFGEEALSEERRAFSRAATVRRYATISEFWTRHTPEVKPGLTIQQIAAHAITTNAAAQLSARVRELGIEDEVTAEARVL